MAKLVGIKELKDHASSIIDEVEKTRRPITVTRNNKPIAKIVPVVSDIKEKDFFKSANEELRQIGRISSLPKQDWASLNLRKVGGGSDADSAAIRAISEDRDER